MIEKIYLQYQKYYFFINTFLSVLSVSIFLDIKPLLSQYFNIAPQEKQPFHRRMNIVRQGERPPVLDSMIAIAKSQEWSIQNIQIEIKDSSLVKIHFVGEFLHFYHFLELLIQQNVPLFCRHFSLTWKNNSIDILIGFEVL